LAGASERFGGRRRMTLVVWRQKVIDGLQIVLIPHLFDVTIQEGFVVFYCGHGVYLFLRAYTRCHSRSGQQLHLAASTLARVTTAGLPGAGYEATAYRAHQALVRWHVLSSSYATEQLDPD
jgi:hypothetical protein